MSETKTETAKKAKKVELTKVQFEKPMTFNGKAYIKGEIAGFPKNIAELCEVQKFGKIVK